VVSVPDTVSIPGRARRPDAAADPPPIAIAPFRLGRTPVTNTDYAPFLETGRVAPPPWWRTAGFDSPGQPVVGVTWEDARLYAEWLSQISAARWRLPTEAEWEHAACGGLENPATVWGDRVPDGEIPGGPLEAPWETGRGTPNGYGLLDMGTIVHEWCLDRAEPGREPPRRASRGGSWRHAVRWSSPFARSSLPPDRRYSDYGFRVLREIEEA